MTNRVRPACQTIRRVAITVPPKHWFYGIDGAFFSICRQSLIDLGCSVFEVSVDAFLPPDAARLPSLIEDVRSFRPEVAIGLPHGVSALLCRMPAERDGRRPNLFTDILELPTICIWDHEPVGLASQLLGPLPDHPAGSTAGAHKRLRDVLSHPLLLHCSRDTGQTRVMGELDLVDASRVMQLGSTTLPGFAPPAGEPEYAAGGGPDVSFIGHFYETPAYGAPTLAALAQSCIAEWIERSDSALWDVLNHHIAGLPPSLIAHLKLDRDETYFWQFARRTHRRACANTTAPAHAGCRRCRGRLLLWRVRPCSGRTSQRNLDARAGRLRSGARRLVRASSDHRRRAQPQLHGRLQHQAVDRVCGGRLCAG